MSDVLFSWGDDTQRDNKVSPMSAEQRAVLRGVFVDLGIASASAQFKAIEDCIGVSISHPNDLSAVDAGRAIVILKRRVRDSGASRSGNSWADRDAPTWIDRM